MYTISNYYSSRYLKFYELTGTFHVPLFAYEPLLKQQEYWNGNISLLHSADEDISPAGIVGTFYSDYENCKDWLTVFNHLKKTNNAGNLKFYADFFKSEAHITGKNKCHVKELDGKYWIVEGNNRLCIAKFMQLSFVNVYVEHYGRDL